MIQEGVFKRVGGNMWHKTRFRLVCATNRDLTEEVGKGRFRSDLYYRLAGWVFHVPALSERREDIPLLLNHFLKIGSAERSPGVDGAVLRYLMTRAFTGNVRELKQLAQRMSLRLPGDRHVTISCIPKEDSPEFGLADAGWPNASFQEGIREALSLGIGLKQISQAAAETAISAAVTEAAGNLREAARRLQVTDRALQLRRAARKRNGKEAAHPPASHGTDQRAAISSACQGSGRAFSATLPEA